jgi:hypothetical protein
MSYCYIFFYRSDILTNIQETMDVCKSVLRIQGMDWPILASSNVVELLTSASTLKTHIEMTTGKVKYLKCLTRSLVSIL